MNVRTDYEQFWKGFWNDATIYGPACRHRRRLVRALVESVPHQRVLDLGCGDGSLLAEWAHTLNAELEGSDISAEALAIAKRNLPDIRLFQLDLMLDDKLERCGYDVIHSLRWGFPFYDLQQTLAYRDGEWGSATMAGGQFGFIRKTIAQLTYYVYFLNSSRHGHQVLALAKSRAFTEDQQ